MGFNKHAIRGLVSALCCAGLAMAAGCSSGGGSGSTPVSPAAISSSNAGRIGQDVYDAQAGLNNAGDVAGAAGGIRSAAAPTVAARSLAGLALGAIRLGAAQASAGKSPNQQTVVNCGGGGTFTLTLTDTPVLNVLDTGDRITATFNNCVDNLSNTTSNGSMSITIGSISGDPDVDTQAWSASVTLTFTNLTISSPEGTVTSNGSITFASSWDPVTQTLSITMTGSNVTMASGSETLRLSGSFSFTATVDAVGDFSIDYTMTVVVDGEGSVAVSTPTPLSGNADGVVDAGQIRVVGNNSTLTLDFTGGGNVTVTLDSDADGNPDCIQNLTVDTLDTFDPAAC